MAEVREVREAALVVRLSAAERASWHAAARAAGWGKTAGWVRSVVAAAAADCGGSGVAGASSSTTSAAPAVGREVLGELARIGSNVNQLARAVNVAARGGQGLELEAAELEALRVEVSRLVAAVAGTSAGTSAHAVANASAHASAHEGEVFVVVVHEEVTPAGVGVFVAAVSDGRGRHLGTTDATSLVELERAVREVVVLGTDLPDEAGEAVALRWVLGPATGPTRGRDAGGGR